MFPVYPQDLSEIKFIILSQPAIVLESSTWLKINFSWTRQRYRDDVGCCSFPCLQHLNPVTSVEVATPLTSFPPQPLSSQEPSSLPLDFWIAFPLSSCSLSLLLSIPPLLSPEKQRWSLLRIPHAFKYMFKCQSRNFAVREPVRAPSLLEFFPPRWYRNNNTYLIELWGFHQMLLARCLVQCLALSGHTWENAATVLPVTFKRRLLVTLTVFVALFSVPHFSVENSETCLICWFCVSLVECKLQESKAVSCYSPSP